MICKDLDAERALHCSCYIRHLAPLVYQLALHLTSKPFQQHFLYLCFFLMVICINQMLNSKKRVYCKAKKKYQKSQKKDTIQKRKQEKEPTQM